jgi:predicted transposase/invertase (TIGR01784 family)
MSAKKKTPTRYDRKKSTEYDSDWIIRLPEGLDNQISGKIARLEEEYKMPYVTSWERIAEKRGEKRGEMKGKLDTAREFIKNGVDINIIARATGFSLEEIEKLAETVQ